VDDEPIAVVGAAIVSGGKCLATRRSASMSMPLKWEFPGGKVEAGESPIAALRREIREELRVEIAVHEHLGTGHGQVGGRALRLDVYAATIVAGVPLPAEHADHGWFGPEELLRLDWPEADRPVVPAVVALMRSNA